MRYGTGPVHGRSCSMPHTAYPVTPDTDFPASGVCQIPYLRGMPDSLSPRGCQIPCLRGMQDFPASGHMPDTLPPGICHMPHSLPPGGCQIPCLRGMPGSLPPGYARFPPSGRTGLEANPRHAVSHRAVAAPTAHSPSERGSCHVLLCHVVVCCSVHSLHDVFCMCCLRISSTPTINNNNGPVSAAPTRNSPS